MSTPRLGAPELTAAQAVPEGTVNETFYWLDAASGGGFKFLDRDLIAPPGSPAQGDTYLVATGGTGAWATHDGEIAVRINTSWEFTTPDEGFIARVADENIWIGYDGAAWVTLTVGGSLPTEATASEIWTGTETGKYISPDKLFDAAASIALTDAATIAVDMNTGINFHVTLGGNRTLGNPTNTKAGQSGRIRVVQDGAGSRTLAYASNWKHIGSAPTIATAIGAVDLFAYFVHDATNIELSYLGTLA